jgi:glyoxylase-like metal-dependent hydrolase (beta-lactamase superfamily II)
MLARETEPVLVGEGVVRLGTELVNWYLVEEGGRVTIVDAGMPKYVAQLDRGLALVGRTRADVAAVILTHGHADHIGVAEPLRTELGVPVHVHHDDESLTTTKKALGKNEASVVPYLRHPHAWKLLVHLASSGIPKAVQRVTTFGEGDGDELDVPGRPRAIHTPGHTTGHCAFFLESRRVLVCGDLLCTRNPLTGGRGPQLMPRPFNLSSSTILDSLATVEDLEAETVLVGHGEPWTQGIADAVQRARQTGPT